MEMIYIVAKAKKIIINRYIIKIMDIKYIILSMIMKIIDNILILNKKIIRKTKYQ
jgi:hypothetical protein